MINLRERLNSSEHRTAYRYLLLDMLGITSELSNIYVEALKDKLSGSDIAPVKRPELLHDISSCPHLVCIGKPNQDINQSLLSASEWQVNDDHLVTKQYVCGWIISELPIDELAESLQSIGERLGILCSSRFIPFYEPFRMQLLQRSDEMTSNWVAKLFPTNFVYYYFDINREIKEIKTENDNNSTQIFLGQSVSFFQQESTSLFRLYVMWYDINKNQDRYIAIDALSKIMDYYLTANLLGLQHSQDKTIFVLFSMQYGDLMQSRTLKEIIEDVAQFAAGELSERFQSVDEKFPLLIQSGL